MRATLPSTRRSDETSLLMNAKPWRSRSRNSGVTRMPPWPQITGSPALARRAACGTRPCRRRPRSRRPCAASPRPPTGRRRAPGCGGWWWSRSRPGTQRSFSAGFTEASRSRSGWAPKVVSCCSSSASPALSAAVTRMRMRDASSLVRPMVKVRTSYDALCSMILSKIADSSPESIRCPSASIVSLAMRAIVLAGGPGRQVGRVGRERPGDDCPTLAPYLPTCLRSPTLPPGTNRYPTPRTVSRNRGDEVCPRCSAGDGR